jgi:hypothetical protein
MRLAAFLSCSIFVTLSLAAFGQARPTPGQPEPVPPMLQNHAPAPEPTTPPAHPFHDARYGITFTVPAAWNLTRKDGEVSTFRLDAPTAIRTTQMRAVANIGFNPHPYSTFSGALFYFSITPKITPTQCIAQASAKAPHTVDSMQIGGLPFTHGYSEHGGICVESRDEIYTTFNKGACYRFDAVINNFCGGDVSGVRDITDRELAAVRKRMQTILDSVHFDSK